MKLRILDTCNMACFVWLNFDQYDKKMMADLELTLATSNTSTYDSASSKT